MGKSRTIGLKGPGINNYFALKLVETNGADGARALCCGPMLAAVEQVIAAQAAEAKRESENDKIDR